jgi:putative ABC transport system ATP-binding protein
MMLNAAIETSQITKEYGEEDQRVSVLRGVNFYALRGEFIMLVGPSGSGKTTFLSILGCVLRPTSGSFRLFDHEIGGLSEDRLPAVRRNLLGFIFQGHNLIGSMTARGNILLQLNLRGIDGASAARETDELLERVGLAHLHNRLPEQLSTGQRQRVAIARALAGHPPIVLADEPTASLDEDTGRAVTRLLKEMAADRGHTVVTVTHDPRIFGYADRIEYLENGIVKRKEEASMSTIDINRFLPTSPPMKVHR